MRHTSNAPTAPAAVPAVSGLLPEYYAALDHPGGPITQILPGQHQTPVSIRIGDDRTGKLVVTVRPPDGQTFAGLTAAADDRTFVVAAGRFPVQQFSPSVSPVAWYLVRLNPGSAHPAALSRLPIPGEPAGTQVSAVALAPAAVTKGLPAGFGWYYGRYSNTALTWVDDGRTLAVMYGINTSASGPP